MGTSVVAAITTTMYSALIVAGVPAKSLESNKRDLPRVYEEENILEVFNSIFQPYFVSSGAVLVILVLSNLVYIAYSAQITGTSACRSVLVG